ncbi:hypothetical protein [Kribbella sp. NPDC055071]
MKVLAGVAVAAIVLGGVSGCAFASDTEVESQPNTTAEQPSGGETTDGAGEEQAGGKWDPCKYLVKADVEKVLGEPVQEGAPADGALDGDNVLSAVCSYDATADDNNNIQLSVGSDAILKQSIGQAGNPIPDLGDEARGANGILYFRKGETAFLITMVKNRDDESQLSPTLFVPLAQEALTKV